MRNSSILPAVLLVISLIPLALSQNATSDLDRRLARWQPVQMPFNDAKLSSSEKQMVAKLVEATQYLDSIYWRQSDPEGLALYKSTRDAKLRRLLMINGSRHDL